MCKLHFKRVLQVELPFMLNLNSGLLRYSMDIRPIRTEAEYEAVLEEIDTLLDAKEGSPQEERLELLSILVEVWEDEHYPIGPPDPIEAIEFMMAQNGLTRKDLEAYIGPRSRVADVLNRQRPLSLKMIRKLNAGLGIPAEVLIREHSPVL